MNKRTKWTVKMDELLIGLIRSGLPARKCAESLNITTRAAQMRSYKLGIIKQKKPKNGFLYCSKCQQQKSLKEFSPCKSSKIKRQFSYYCRECENKNRNTFEYRLLQWAHKTLTQHKKRDNCDVNITTRQLMNKAIENPKCAFCNANLNWFNNKICNDSPTLERLNNEKEINLNNIDIICYQCNATKRNRTLIEFLEYIEKIVPVIKNKLKM